MNTKQIVKTAADATAWTIGSILRLALRIVLTVIMVFIITGLFFTCIFAYYVKTDLNPKLKISLSDFALSLSSTIWATDSNGENYELQMLESKENRIWVDYENLPEGMEHALVAIEDKRFYDHRGVDWYRTAGAVVQMFFSMSNDFGGSTITQQLIKNRTENQADLVSRKILEIFQALELEKTYEKREIIEWYLNTVYFGEGCNGVYTAARTYFGKDVWDLSLAESASIIGITNNPSKYDPFIANVITDKELGLTMTCREWNKFRQELVLQQMYEQGYITYAEYRAAVNEELNFVLPVNEVRSQTISSFYVEMVVDDVLRDLKREFGYSDQAAYERLYYGGLQVYSCLDPDIQAVVDEFYSDRANLPQADYNPSGQPLQSAMMIVDPFTGDIKGMAGAVGAKTTPDAWNYAIDSKRQVGSSIKPLAVYGPALEYGLITQNTLVNDSPDVKLSGTTWTTRNSGDSYSGIISIREALRASKNTVAAQIVDKLTPAESFNYLTEKLGFTSLVEADADYAPMALGALTEGATVREMAQAFTSFVNNGVMSYARSYTRVLDSDGKIILNNSSPKQITSFSPNTAANICDMLENAVIWGTGSEARITGQHVAGKTGTTSNNNDRYFVGFTEYYVAAVWTGYDTPAAMYFGNRNPAAIIFQRIMSRLHEGLESRPFPTPSIGAPTTIFGDLEEEPEEPDESETVADPIFDNPLTTPGVAEPQIPSRPSVDQPQTGEPITPTPPAVTGPPAADDPPDTENQAPAEHQPAVTTPVPTWAPLPSGGGSDPEAPEPGGQAA